MSNDFLVRQHLSRDSVITIGKNMETVEIKVHRKRLAGILALMVLVMAGTTIFILPGEMHAHHYLVELLYIGLNAALIYRLHDLVKRLKSKTAVITLSLEAITIEDEDSDYSYSWKDIREVAVSNDDCTPYLTLHTIYEERTVSISWLDKNPGKIKELIGQYSDRAAANEQKRENKLAGAWIDGNRNYRSDF